MKPEGKILIGIGLATGAVLLIRKIVAGGEIILQDLTINPTAVHPGEMVTISATAINTSDATLTADITLGGDFDMQQTITLGPGESIVVEFKVTPQAVKSYVVNMDGLSGTFVCTEEPVADIRLSNLVIDPQQCNVGDTVTIQVTATNYGTAPGSKTITCTVT